MVQTLAKYTLLNQMVRALDVVIELQVVVKMQAHDTAERPEDGATWHAGGLTAVGDPGKVHQVRGTYGSLHILVYCPGCRIV